MSTTEEPQYVADTLDWCNSIRADKGLSPLERLPKGKRADQATCPCGTATGAWVGGENYRLTRESSEICQLPNAVQEFVYHFDEGELPQYDSSRDPGTTS